MSYASKKRNPKKPRIQQVPHLITHPSQPSSQIGASNVQHNRGHRFTVQTSTPNILTIGGVGPANSIYQQQINANTTKSASCLAQPEFALNNSLTNNNNNINNNNNNNNNNLQNNNNGKNLKPLQKVENSANATTSRLKFNPDEVFDLFLKENLANSPDDFSSDFFLSIETFINDFFDAKMVALWSSIENLQILYSSFLQKVTSSSQGLVGFCYFTKNVQRIKNPASHPSYHASSDYEYPTLLFPLFDHKNNVFGVVQVLREREFTEDDEAFIKWFTEKIKLIYKFYSNPLQHQLLVSKGETSNLNKNSTNSDSTLNNYNNTNNTNNNNTVTNISLFENSLLDMLEIKPKINDFLIGLNESMTDNFCCHSIEIWRLQNQNVTKYDCHGKVDLSSVNEAGIAGDCLSRKATVNTMNVLLHSNYSEVFDGEEPSAALFVPVIDHHCNSLFTTLTTTSVKNDNNINESEKDNNINNNDNSNNNNTVWCIALRTPIRQLIFTKQEETLAKKLAPLIVLSLTNTEIFSLSKNDLKTAKKEREGLAALLEVVEIISNLQLNDNSKLIEKILDKASNLTNSDRCSLFLLNESRDRLQTYLQKGLDKAIDIPVTKGIAGQTVLTSKTMNVSDVYESKWFDSTVDMETGYKTNSILCVPIYNSRGEIIGATEMVNKKNKKKQTKIEENGENIKNNTNNDINYKGKFEEWDENLISIFNVFFGIALENSKLYHDSLVNSKQLKSFFNTAFSLAKNENVQKAILEILLNAKEGVHAQHTVIFLIENTKRPNQNQDQNQIQFKLTTFVSDLDKMPLEILFDDDILKLDIFDSKQPFFINNIDEIGENNETNKSDDKNESNESNENNYKNNSSLIKKFNGIDQQTGVKTNSLLIAPVLSKKSDNFSSTVSSLVNSNKTNNNDDNNDNNNLKYNGNESENESENEVDDSMEVIALVVMLNKDTDFGMSKKNSGFTNPNFEKHDLTVTEAFASFAGILLENNRLKSMTQVGDKELEMKKYIKTEERDQCNSVCPVLLELTEEEKVKVSGLNCFAMDFKGIGHFKELFYFFNHFHLLEEYKVTNERFFRFIFTISSTYNDVPYHNWTHACDVTQYVFYEINTSNMDRQLTKMELFCLLISSVCHDANHGGLNNVFNIKAETPLGILFKDQSVMEMHHLTQSIPIISQDDINLFHTLNNEETKKMWNMFINTILATDMAHHFKLVKKATGLVEGSNATTNNNGNNNNLEENGKENDDEPTEWDWENSKVRILALQLLLKVADISNVSRPFEYADKWCDILCREFFRQGDLEKESGIGLTSPLNDRENNDKPKSQIGFYNFICLPLYQVVAKVFPPLQVNVDSVKANLEVWKSMVQPKQ